MDVGPNTSKANTDMNAEVDTVRLSITSGVMINTDAKLNTDRLVEVNKIAKKETKVYEFNLF